MILPLRTPLTDDLNALRDMYSGCRVMVTGGRGNYNWSPLWEALDIFQPKTVIEGGATGWDEGAYRWAEYHATKLRTVAAPWESLGRGAGLARNVYMLSRCRVDLVIVGDGGPGTAHCKAAALAEGLPILDLSEY